MTTTPRRTADPIIRVEDLTAGYDDVVLLENVSFDVRRGEVFVILGGSGCGKSTLLKHMIGLYQPHGGPRATSTATTSSPPTATRGARSCARSASCTSRARCSAR